MRVDNHSQTHLIIAKGKKIGKGTVTVIFDETFSKGNIEKSVKFYVLDKLNIFPSPFLRVLKGSYIQYSLKRNIEGRFEDLESINYDWSLTNTSIAEINQKGLLRALELGSSHIVVKDKSFDLNEVRGALTVSKPYYLKFKVEQINPYFYENILKITNYINEPLNFVKGYKYQITVEVYDPDHQLIYITDDFLFNVTVKGDANTESFSTNKQVFIIQANEIGSIDISASLDYEKQPLFLYSSVRVYEKLKINYENDIIYLPTEEGIQQTFLVKVTGGSGDYIFITRNNDLMRVDEGGLLTTYAEGEGHIFVVDALNTLNGDYRKVFVSVPASLNFRKGIREVPFETTLCLDLVVRDSKGNEFAQYDALHFIWQIIDPTIFQLTKSGNCLFGFKSISIGHTAVKVKYRKSKMIDNTFIASFNPLKIEIPNHNPIVSLGSEIEFILTGGPTKWLNTSKLTHYSKLQDEKLMKLDFIQIKENEQIYVAKCLEYGEQEITFITEHNLYQENTDNTIATTSILYSCHEPYSLKVVPLNPKTDQEVTTIPVLGSKILVYNIKNNQTINVKINVYNKENELFYDISTFHIQWNLNENNFAKLLGPLIVGRNRLQIDEAEGYLFLNATILGYLPSVKFNGLLKEIFGEAELRVTSNLIVIPSWYLLFKHLKNKFKIQTQGGSGKFEYKLNNSRIVTFNPISSNSIEVFPINEGYAGFKSHDLLFGTFAESTTKVSDVYSIQINGSRLVQENNNITISLLAIDDEGNYFDSWNIEFMNPRIEIDYTSIATIKPLHVKDLYIVHGISEGIVRLTASVITSNGKKLISPTFQIQVYKELKVDPPHLLLIPGSIYQLLVTGGPTEGLIETFFKITSQEPENTIRIDKSGVVTANFYGTANLEIERKYDKQTFAILTVKIDVVKLDKFITPNEITIYEGKCTTLSIEGFTNSVSPGILNTLKLQSNFFEVSFSTEQNNIQLIGSSKEHYGTLSSIIICANYEIGKAEINIHGKFNHPEIESWELYGKTNIIIEKKLCINDLCSNEFIITPKSSIDIEPNKNINTMKYSLAIPNDIITIDRRGIINSLDKEGYSGIIVDDTIDNEHIIQKVQISIPHTFGIESPETKRFVNEFSIPMGQNSMIKLFALKKGEIFSSFNGLELQDRLNIQDIISVDFKKKGYLMIRTLREGQVCLEISSPNIQSVYIRFNIFGAITPINPNLVIGDKLKFQILSKEVGYWDSDNHDLLKVEDDGNAIALKNGKTKVSFSSNQMTTYSPVYISKLSNGMINVQKSVISEKEFEVKVTLFDELGNNISNPPKGVIRDLNVQCESKNFNFEVKTIIDQQQTVICLLKTSLVKGTEKVELYIKHGNYIVDLPSFIIEIKGPIDQVEPISPLTLLFILIIITGIIFWFGRGTTEKKTNNSGSDGYDDSDQFE